jgi:hypothetical protein
VFELERAIPEVNVETREHVAGGRNQWADAALAFWPGSRLALWSIAIITVVVTGGALFAWARAALVAGSSNFR